MDTAISNAKSVKEDILEQAKTAEEINASVEAMNKVDYTSTLDNLSKQQAALETSIKQYALVDNPKEQYIIQSLKKVKEIKDISAVTEDNDPNGDLGKPGGYTS